MKTFDSRKKFSNHAGFEFEDGKRFEQRRFTCETPREMNSLSSKTSLHRTVWSLANKATTWADAVALVLSFPFCLVPTRGTILLALSTFDDIHHAAGFALIG
jgi:hypothetical protein